MISLNNTSLRDIAIAGSVWLFAAAPVHALTLEEALDLTVENYPAVAQSIAMFDVDIEAGAQDIASRRPTVALIGTGAYANTKSSGVFGEQEDNYPMWSAQLEVRQPLFRLDWGARKARAEALRGRADHALTERANTVLMRIADRYFAVLDAQEALATREEEARAVRRSLEDTQRRFEVELVARNDVIEAEARDDAAQAQLLSAQRELDNARDALHELTGPDIGELPRLLPDTEFPSLDPADANAWVEAAMQGNPMLLQLSQDRDVARANERTGRAAFLPEVDLFARAGADDTSRFDFGQRIDDQRVGIELTMPLYAGGQRSARIRESAAQLRMVDAEVARTRGEVEREVRQRYRAVESSRIEARAFARALASAREAQRATANGYEAGTRTITDLLDAASRVAAAERDYSSSRHRVLLNMLRLKEIIGALEVDDFRQVDRMLGYQPQDAGDESPAGANDRNRDPS